MLSQKFIILVVLFNVAIGLGLNMGTSSATEIGSEFDEFGEMLGVEKYDYDQGDMFAKGVNEDRDTEGTVGKTVEWGGKLFKIVWDSVNIASVKVDADAHFIEKYMGITIGIFRGLLALLLALEGYMIFKNRKTS